MSGIQSPDLSLTRAELLRHWLLETVIECPHSLGMLFPAVAEQAFKMVAMPGAQAEDHKEALLHLFNAGMICFPSEVPGDDVRTAAG